MKRKYFVCSREGFKPIAPKVVVNDQDSGMKIAIEKEFTNSRLMVRKREDNVKNMVNKMQIMTLGTTKNFNKKGHA